MENQKREKYGNQIILHKFPYGRLFRNEIHCLLNRADAIVSADIIFRTWGISLLCRSGYYCYWCL